MLWLGCNVVMVGSLAGLWYCFKLTIKQFFLLNNKKLFVDNNSMAKTI
jgi:hypothetical protein